MISVKFDRDPGLVLQRLARKFREDANQANARLAVSTGKELAIVTEFRGKTAKSKKTTTQNLENSAKRVCYIVKGEFLQKLRSLGTRARVKYDTWRPVKPGQLVTDPGAINRHIDKMRDRKKNTPKKLPWDDLIIVSKSAFEKAMTARRIAAERNLARGKEQLAYERAWTNTTNWYKKALKRREKNWGI